MFLVAMSFEKTIEERFVDVFSMYKKRFGKNPKKCHVNKNTVDGFKKKTHNGVKIIMDEQLRKGDFWMVVNE